MQIETRGWAVVQDGKIMVRTVSPTRRAAIVNWLYTYGGRTVLDRHSDKEIDAMWLTATAKSAVTVCEVTIAAKVPVH